MIGRIVFTAALMAFTTSVAYAEETYRAVYNFYWNGLLVSTAEADVRLASQQYEIAIDFRMRGMAKLFANGRSSLRSSGWLEPDGDVRPMNYSSKGRWDGEDYSREIVFNSDGTMTELVQDWPKKWLEKYPREDVPETLQKGPDPASLAVALLNATLPDDIDRNPVVNRVFDGDSVFDWGLTCKPQTSFLEEKGKSPFFGESRECGLTAELVAGKRILTDKEKKKLEKKRRKEEKRRAQGKEVEKDEPPRFWLMKLTAREYLVPVRAEFPSGMGQVTMYLKELQAKPGHPEQPDDPDQPGRVPGPETAEAGSR